MSPGLLERLDRHVREVIRGASVTLSMRMLAGALGLLVNLLLARLLGPDGTGHYFLALSVVSITATVGRLGLDNAVMRFVAASAARGAWGRADGILRKSLVLTATTGVGLAAVVVIGAPWIARRWFSDPTLARPLGVMAVAIPLLTTMHLHGHALKGLKKIARAQATEVLVLPAVTIPGILLLAPPFGAVGAAAAYAVGATVAGGVGVILWRASLRPVPENTSFPTSRLLATAWPLLAVALMGSIMEWTATVVLGIYRTPEEVGIYNICYRLALALGLALTSVNTIAAPKFAELFEKNELGALAATARNSARLAFVTTLPFLFLLLAVPEFVLGLFGQEFVGGIGALRILAIGQALSVAAGPVGFLLMMTGRERVYRNATVVAAGVNVLAQLALVPRWGLIGGAAATASSLALLQVLATLGVWRRLRIRSFPVRLWE